MPTCEQTPTEPRMAIGAISVMYEPATICATPATTPIETRPSSKTHQTSPKNMSAEERKTKRLAHSSVFLRPRYASGATHPYEPIRPPICGGGAAGSALGSDGTSRHARQWRAAGGADVRRRRAGGGRESGEEVGVGAMQRQRTEKKELISAHCHVSSVPGSDAGTTASRLLSEPVAKPNCDSGRGGAVGARREASARRVVDTQFRSSFGVHHTHLQGGAERDGKNGDDEALHLPPIVRLPVTVEQRLVVRWEGGHGCERRETPLINDSTYPSVGAASATHRFDATKNSHPKPHQQCRVHDVLG